MNEIDFLQGVSIRTVDIDSCYQGEGTKGMRLPRELEELKNYPNWVARREKMPINPKTGKGASSTDGATWGKYDDAVASVQNFGLSGLGFVLTGTPFAVIDLDHVISETGELDARAGEIIAAVDSYTEISPSGRGLHIWFRLYEPLSNFGERNKIKNANGTDFEIYDTGRYITVTGKPYGKGKSIRNATEALREIYPKFWGSNDKKLERVQLQPSTDNLWDKMFNSANGAKIRNLYNGDISAYGNDDSSADLAMCNYLAFWTGKNASEMDRLFRETGLMRDKWDRKTGSTTYGAMTIEKAIADTSEVYEPRQAKTIEQVEYKSEKISDYLNDFLSAVQKNREGKAISTGFENLDEILDGGLYPGLYVIGANSSLGKTTLVLQIADNIAKAGRGVLFFSLEMSRNELIAKILSRMSFEAGGKYLAKTTRGVLMGNYTNEEKQILANAIQALNTYGEKLEISEGTGEIGATNIAERVREYMEHNGGEAPVVIIDYLQILAPYNIKYTDKQNTDKNILELKRLSRDLQIPVLGISSFNRENYRTPVSMASFKESGAIEYSSDVLIGLQYFGWDYQEGEKELDRIRRLSETRKQMDAAAREGLPQRIELVILKNRNGRRGKIFFDFFSKFNYFRGAK